MLRYIPRGSRDLLTNSTFVRLFSGRVITDAGDSFYYIGTMWLVWELTRSPFYTGLAGALIQIPNALRFLVGPLVDRWQLHRILLGTQLINCVGVLAVPIAAWTGWLSVWVVLAIIPILNFVNNFVYPAQNAALPRIVEDEQLTRANSLFSTTISTVDMLANATAGVLIATIGAVALFIVDAATFAIAALLFIGITVPAVVDSDDAGGTDEDDGEVDGSDADEGYFSDLRDGLAYVRGSVFLLILLGGMVANFVTFAANPVWPAFADSLAGPAAYGLLLAAMGAGSLAGSGGAFLVDEYAFARVTVVGFLVASVSRVVAVAVPGVWATSALLFASVVPIGVFNVLFGSMMQSGVDNTYLGRVSSLMTSVLTVMMPVGALLGGMVAGIVGSRSVIYGTGVGFAFIAVLFLVHPGLRSLPPVAEADEIVLGLGSPPHTDTENVGIGSGSRTE